MLKGLNQNKSSTSMNPTGQSMSGASSNKKLAEQMCEPSIPQTIKNLPKANVALVENDFGKKRSEIIICYKVQIKPWFPRPPSRQYGCHFLF